MLKFPTPRSVQTVVIVLIAIGLIALALGGYLTPLSRFLLQPVIAAQTWVASRYQAVQSLITSPVDVARLRQRNSELEAENAHLQAQVIELQQQITEVQVLSTLLGFVRAHPENEYVTAAVIGRDISPFLQYVIINRGSDDGLRRGMPVVTAQGLIGRVAGVTSGAARIQLINDAGSIVNIRLQQSGAEAILVGQVTGEVVLQEIPQDATIQPGDLVLTSGLGGEFPPNLLIGQVSTVRRRSSDLFQSASVQPVADFTQLEIVLVIVNFQPVDITPLLPTPSVP